MRVWRDPCGDFVDALRETLARRGLGVMLQRTVGANAAYEIYEVGGPTLAKLAICFYRDRIDVAVNGPGQPWSEATQIPGVSVLDAAAVQTALGAVEARLDAQAPQTGRGPGPG